MAAERCRWRVAITFRRSWTPARWRAVGGRQGSGLPGQQRGASAAVNREDAGHVLDHQDATETALVTLNAAGGSPPGSSGSHCASWSCSTPLRRSETRSSSPATDSGGRLHQPQLWADLHRVCRGFRGGLLGQGWVLRDVIAVAVGDEALAGVGAQVVLAARGLRARRGSGGLRWCGRPRRDRCSSRGTGPCHAAGRRGGGGAGRSAGPPSCCVARRW